MIRRYQTFAGLGVLTAFIIVGAGCKDVELGTPLESHSFEMPVSIAVHPKGYALVLSSNFDLFRKSASLRVVDLNLLTQRLENPPSNPDEDYFAHHEVILDEGAIAVENFASSVELVPSEQGGLALVTLRESAQLVLVDLIIDEQAGQPRIDLKCWSDGDSSGKGDFPSCSGDKHVLDLKYPAPFDVQIWYEKNAEPYPTGDITAYIGHLAGAAITAVRVPADRKTAPSELFHLDDSSVVSDQFVFSPETGFMFAARRSSQQSLFSLQFFDPALGEAAIVYQATVQSGLQNIGSRSVDLLADGTTATLLVRNPNMLIYLDTSLGTNNMPKNSYLGHVVLDELPIRVKNHKSLSFVTATEGDTLYVIDTVSMKLIDMRDDVCQGPFDMAIYESDGKEWLLVTCFEESRVAVLDVDEASDSFLEVLARIGG